MLVLSRRTGESVSLAVNAHTITVEVLEVRGHRVRLGISAPSDVNIARGELPRRTSMAVWASLDQC
ncbi:MAG: carbon storage regulator [Pirellulales bacterium]